MPDHVHELRGAGYTFLRGGLGLGRVPGLAAEVQRLFDLDDHTWGADRLVELDQRGLVHNVCDQSAAIARLLDDSPVYPVIDAVLGQDYILNCANTLALFPGDGRYPWDFHTDTSGLNGVAFPADTVPGVNCLYFFDHVDEANGATWIVPFSHRCVVRRPEPHDLAAAAVPAVVDPGDILLFDSRLWHCAGTNCTSVQRNALKMLFTRPWYRPVFDHTRSVSPTIVAALGERGRRLLGHGKAPSTSVVDHRLGAAG